MSSILANLNPEQTHAVQETQGPVLIIAGAGTGKTRVITHKIAYLVLEKKIKPTEILALTFTEKAAQEMQERVDLMLPLGYEELWIKTFHAFADRILKQEALALGLDPQYRLLSSAEAWLFVRQHLFEFDLDYYRPLGNPTRFVHALITLFSRAKDELITPSDYLHYAHALEEKGKYQTVAEGAEDEELLAEEIKKAKEIARVYQQYQDFLIRESLLDFGDLLFYTHKLFSEKKTILAKYQKQFRYILVDEFQDTNYAQNEIVKLLGKGQGNITVCGDDDQSIYKFRGASISNILQFKHTFPDTRTFVLTDNYRSTQTILDHAYQLIQNNNPERLEIKEQISKKLNAVRSEKAEIEPELLVATHEYEEADMVVKKIIELALHEKRDYRDFAILSRANDHLFPFIETLKALGIPFQMLGKRGLYSEKIIQALLAYLRFLTNPADAVSLLQILRMPIFKLAPGFFPLLMQQAKKQSYSLWETCKNLIQANDLPPGTKEKLQTITELIETHQQHSKQLPVSRLFYQIIIDIGLLKQLLENEDENTEDILNLNMLYRTLRAFEKNSNDSSVYSYIEYVDLMIEAGDDPKTTEWVEDKNAVKLITVHSAKGLEFPVVFMVSLVNQRFPSQNRSDPLELPDTLVKEIIPSGDIHLQEERRLFYVGMTRAQDRLFFSYANLYASGKIKRKPSVFLQEIFDQALFDMLAEKNDTQLTPAKQIKKTDEQEINWHELLPRYFSYTQLETFNLCALQYKYAFVYRLPVPEKHQLIFGQTIHRTLKDFYTLFMQEQTLTEEKLLQLYEQNWRREGFLTASHVEQYFQQGKRLLQQFYQKNQNHWGSPLYLEKEFVYKVTPTIALKGYFDRVDMFPDGSFEIIDYKTGEVRDLEQKNKEVKKGLQLALYALAGHEVFHWDLAKTTLSFYFLEPGEKISLQKTDKDLAHVKEAIITTVEVIKKSDFKPKKGPHCSWCGYRQICPLW